MIFALNAYVRMSEMVEKISSVRTYLMGIAMVMVILFHCGVYPFSLFGYWGVDVFLFLSGFGICFSLRKKEPLHRFYYKRFIRIIPAAILCGLVFYFFDCAHGCKKLAPFGLNLWYIRTILFFYLFSPLIYVIINRWEIKAIFSVIAFSEVMSYCFDGVWFVGPILTSTLSWSFSRLPIYVLGMALPYFAQKKDLKVPLAFLTCSSILGALMLFTLRVYQQNHHLGYVMWLFMPSFILAPAITLTGMMVFSVMRRLPAFLASLLCYAGTYSLEIYVIHESLLKKVPTLREVVINDYFAKAICIALSFALAFLVNRICTMVVNKSRIYKFSGIS